MLLTLFFLVFQVAGVLVNPMPYPRQLNWGNGGPVEVAPYLTLETEQPSQIVSDAFYRTMNTVVELKWTPVAVEGTASFEAFPTAVARRHDHAVVTRAKVLIDDYEAKLALGVDESYSLVLESGSDAILVEAATVWGALRAFSTLQQLIVYGGGSDGYFYVENPVEIWDEPLFPHRGLMIDSSRNFLSTRVILEQIDIMALVKLNTLHWHLTDTQSWPVQLTGYPEMTQDAFSSREVYSQQDIRYIVEYARARGVRVVPEIDMPGHSRAGWRQIDEKLVACGNAWWGADETDPTRVTAVEPPPGQLDIFYNKTLSVVSDIFNEISELFDDNVFHVGADELQLGCYNFSVNTQRWFAEDPTRNLTHLVEYWVDKTLPIFNNTDTRRLTMWEDIITDSSPVSNLPKDVILQSWNNGMDNVKKLTGQGYDVVVSSSSHLYLDCGKGGWVSNDPRYVDSEENEEFNLGTGGSWCGPYKTWQRIYNYDITANLTEEEASHVLGAEAALWLEQIDSVVLTLSIWPRTAALAEMTWSGNKKDGRYRTTDVTQRILNLREYLVELGHGVSPLMPKYCALNPHACDLYRNQSVVG